MDASPLDLQTLTRLANDLFREGTAAPGVTGLASPVPEAPQVPDVPLPAPGRPAVPPGFAPPLGAPSGPGPAVPFAPDAPAVGLGFGAAPLPSSPGSLRGFDRGLIPDFGDAFSEEAALRGLLSQGGAAPGGFPSGGGFVFPASGGPAIPNLAPGYPGLSDPHAPGFETLAGLGQEHLVNPAPAAARQAPGLPGLSMPGPETTPSFYFVDEGYFADDVPNVAPSAGTIFHPGAARNDFPVFKQRVNGYPLIWLDNGATTQKPQSVIDRVSAFYENENSNIHRAAHELAARATDAYEDARKTVQRFINAGSIDELIFVRGTTEGINLVAQSFGRRFIGKGDEIVVSHFEHHANIVPWYLLAKETGAILKAAPVDNDGNLLLDEFERLLNDRTKIVAFTHVSNAIGTVLPAKAMTEIAHRHGIPVLLDGAQSISHMPVDVQDIGCDFFVFSGHKVFAPTGIGVVYGKKAILDSMPPWQGGGNMIKDVTFEKIEFQPAPTRFEAGTGNIADAVGLGEALKYLERIGMANIARYEHDLLDYALKRLREIRGLRMIGNPVERAGIVSLLIDGLAPDVVGKALNQKGIAVRAGHHCAMPILRRFGVEATVRPSFALYNTIEDVDRLAEALHEIAINRAQ